MVRDYGNKLFVGAAKNYAKYRAIYPDRLFQKIIQNFALDGRGRLLDLGCGTGELAIPLAKYFQNVLAMDPDVEMLAEGRRKAYKAGTINISWQKGSSKELNSLKGSFKLVTIGRSFHWMDQKQVLDELYDLLEPGGGVVIVGTEPQKQDPAAEMRDKIIKETVTKYLGAKRLAGSRTYEPPSQSYEKLLPGSKFNKIQKREYVIIFHQNIDQIIGNLFSMSWALPSHFGEQIDSFETELRQKLSANLADEIVNEKVHFNLYTLTK